MPGRVFNLKAENDALRTDWIAVINHTLEQIADIKVLLYACTCTGMST